MQIHLVEQHAYELLEKLPDFLFYHNKKHTESVLKAAGYLGLQHHLHDEDLCLVKSAALLHDTGFTKSTSGEHHEKESCSIAEQILPKAGYNKKQINTVRNLIISTRLPQSPHSMLEEILCDADLFYLGTDHFFTVSHLLYREMLALQKINNEREWYNLQVRFLSSHQYFTPTAKEQLEPKKQLHLQLVIKKQETLL